MEKVRFDKAWIDEQGNVLGEMGTGKTQIGFDHHIDTIGIGNIENWKFDPYEGFEDENLIGGRGSSDQLGGIVSAVYGAKIMKDLGFLNDKYRVLVTGNCSGGRLRRKELIRDYSGIKDFVPMWKKKLKREKICLLRISGLFPPTELPLWGDTVFP